VAEAPAIQLHFDGAAVLLTRLSRRNDADLFDAVDRNHCAALAVLVEDILALVE